MECRKYHPFKQGPPWLFRLLLLWVIIGGALSLRAVPGLDNRSPIGFFTTTANLFLKTSGYNFTVTNIPVYPTNYYTPALHRLLQVSANLYDASTNRAFDDGSSPNGPFYPTVFRPTFFCDGTNIFINGYVEDISTNGAQNAYVSPPLSLPDDFSLVPTNTNSAINIYNIPYVIGARKGFPNFNAFTMESVSLLTRKVQLVRVNNGDPQSLLQTNIQYVLSISNLFGAAAWNSYINPISRPVDIIGVDNVSMFLSASNDATGISANLAQMTLTPYGIGPVTIQTNQWPGFIPTASSPNRNTASFQVPLNATVAFVSNAVYHPTQLPQLSSNGVFDSGLGYIQPHFLLTMTNQLRFIMTDHLTGRLIDYVHFNMNFTRDLTGELYGANGGDGGVWDTTRLVNSDTTSPIVGVINQVSASLGFSTPNYPRVTQAAWVTDQLQASSMVNAISNFSAFYFGTSAGSIVTAFTPTRTVTITYSWQANDPLVHYLQSDLSPSIVVNYPAPVALPVATLTNLSIENTRYLPWNDFGNISTFDANATNLAVKDPLVTSSDAWLFPTNNQLTFAALGSVHRGTPWQTFYLKSATVPAATWQTWTGNLNPPDALLSQPTNDWNLAAALIPLLAPQDPHALFGYNQSNPNLWGPVFQGMTVLTNTPALVPLQIDDTANSNAIIQMVSGINVVRNRLPGDLFSNVGQILATPELSVASPFLNLSQTSSVTDAAYESIPSQLLPLLRPDSIGSISANTTPPQFQFTGIDGYAYYLQASSDLINWTNIATLFPTNGILPFTDPNPSGALQRFYRAQLVP